MCDEVMFLVVVYYSGVKGGNEFWEEFYGMEIKCIIGLVDYLKGWIEFLCDLIYKGMGDYYLGEDNYYLNIV